MPKNQTMRTITIKKPDDWHLHLRSGKMLSDVVKHTASQFTRALIMPNLTPPILTVTDALNYYQKIKNSLPKNNNFEPKMALYLTENTKINDIKLASETDNIIAYKFYPAGATTNSDSGVKSIDKIMPQLETIAKTGLVLCVHGESTDKNIDIFDREKVFIDKILTNIHQKIPDLKIVLEHISTKEGIDFVENFNDNIAGTLTAHHLLENRNAMFQGGIKPHHYCLPILKRQSHQNALIKAAISGNPKFFAGTDSAPHLKNDKESACGCAGIYTAHAALELYAEIFDKQNALDKLENFMSVNGAKFYNLPINQQTITLEKQSWQTPNSYFNNQVVPYRAGKSIHWKTV